MLFRTRDGRQQEQREHPRQCTLLHQGCITVSVGTNYGKVEARAHTKTLGTMAILLWMLTNQNSHDPYLIVSHEASAKAPTMFVSKRVKNHIEKSLSRYLVHLGIVGSVLCMQSHTRRSKAFGA